MSGGLESSSQETAFASVTHPNSVTGQTGLLGLNDVFGITDPNDFGIRMIWRYLLCRHSSPSLESHQKVFRSADKREGDG
jgi:hypothetical protein